LKVLSVWQNSKYLFAAQQQTLPKIVHETDVRFLDWSLI
jgi:hypothetical protein